MRQILEIIVLFGIIAVVMFGVVHIQDRVRDNYANDLLHGRCVERCAPMRAIKWEQTAHNVVCKCEKVEVITK